MGKITPMVHRAMGTSKGEEHRLLAISKNTRLRQLLKTVKHDRNVEERSQIIAKSQQSQCQLQNALSVSSTQQ